MLFLVQKEFLFSPKILDLSKFVNLSPYCFFLLIPPPLLSLILSVAFCLLLFVFFCHLNIFYIFKGEVDRIYNMKCIPLQETVRRRGQVLQGRVPSLSDGKNSDFFFIIMMYFFFSLAGGLNHLPYLLSTSVSLAVIKDFSTNHKTALGLIQAYTSLKLRNKYNCVNMFTYIDNGKYITAINKIQKSFTMS